MSNPSLQCSVCGQWKRLHGKDETGIAIQRFYPCCGENGQNEHVKNVCDECCKKACPYRAEYIYLGDRFTAPELKGKTCSAVRQNGKCIRGRNGSMLVAFEGRPVVVIARLLRKIK